MSWASESLAAFKTYLGGTPADAQATAALDLALAVVESWLDRPLELKQRTQEDVDVARAILLRAWPVDNVTSVTPAGYPPTTAPIDLLHVQLDKPSGRLIVPGCYAATSTVYSGGFPETAFPADLQFALFAVAGALYPQLAAGAGANGGAASQPVVRVSTPDVGMIEFQRAGAGSDSRLLGAVLSPSIDALLGRYRNQSVIGGA